MGLINAQLKPMAAARLKCVSQPFRGPASSGNRLYKIIAIFQVEFVPKRLMTRQYLFGERSAIKYFGQEVALEEKRQKDSRSPKPGGIAVRQGRAKRRGVRLSLFVPLPLLARKTSGHRYF